MKLKSSMWWGPFPQERDGGAVVNYYLLRMLNYLNPKHDFYCVPKVPEEADTESLPFAQFKLVRVKGIDDPTPFKAIPEFMYMNDIPLLNMFHLPHEWIKMAKYVNQMGGKTIVHQTIHWQSDDVFKSDALQDVDGWICPTRWGSKILSRVGKIKRKKIKYIPHGVSLREFYPHQTLFRKELSLKKDQKIILFVGRCSLFKGAREIIPVMKNLIREYDCLFMLRAGVFGTPAGKKIGRLFDLLANQSSNIYFFPDWYPPEYMHEIMASADILLQPSGHEGFDVPLIEAMASRVPIAVSNLPNHWEILGKKNKYCGIFMEPTVKVGTVNDGRQDIKVPSSDMIYGTLKYMLENPDECEAMARHGYGRAKRYYGLEMVGKKWLKYMDSLFPKNYEMRLKI